MRGLTVLSIRIQVSTYLADAEPEALRALVDLLEIEEVVLEEPMTEEVPSPQEMAEAVLPEGEMDSPDGEPAETDEDGGVAEATPEERP